jgi:hypothetical protein
LEESRELRQTPGNCAKSQESAQIPWIAHTKTEKAGDFLSGLAIPSVGLVQPYLWQAEMADLEAFDPAGTLTGPLHVAAYGFFSWTVFHFAADLAVMGFVYGYIMEKANDIGFFLLLLAPTVSVPFVYYVYWDIYLQVLRGPSVPCIGKAPWPLRARFEPCISRGWSQYAGGQGFFAVEVFSLICYKNRLNYPPFAYIMTLLAKFVVAIVGVTSADAVEEWKEESNGCFSNATLVWDPTTNFSTPADPSLVPCGSGPSLLSVFAYFSLVSTCSTKVYDVYNFYFNELPAVQTDDTCSFDDFFSGFCMRPTDKDSGLAEPLATE